jgi:putative peptidoglycan lipid II flippase
VFSSVSLDTASPSVPSVYSVVHIRIFPRILRVLSGSEMEKSRIIRSAFIVGGFTSLSRFLGMLRDLATAAMFGTSLPMSAFVIAFRIPNLFRRLFGEGALSSAFIPVFMEARQKQGDEEAWRLANKVFSLVACVLMAITMAGIALASVGMGHVEPGTQKFHILSMTRIMLPYMILICMAALSMAVLNSFHHFAIPAFTPTLMNIVWLAAVIFVCPYLGDTLEKKIYGIAWSVLVSGVLQLAIQVPVLLRHGCRPRFVLDWRDPRVMRVFTLMGPATLGLAVTQINIVVNSLLAGWIGPWAPAALFFSERLLYFPQGILATAMSTVLLPVFAGHAAKQDHAQILDAMNHSLRTLVFVMTPAAIGLLALARPIVQLLYEWGKFDAHSTDLTTAALACYAPGLLIFCYGKVLVPAFYALQDTKTPVLVGLLSVAVNFVLNILFILTWPLYLKHAGLALSTVIADVVNGAVLGFFLTRRLGSPGWRSIFGSQLRALFASGVMAVTCLVAHRALAGVLDGFHPKVAQAGSVLGAIALGMIVFFVVAKLVGSREIADVIEAVRTRRKKRQAASGPRPPTLDPG